MIGIYDLKFKIHEKDSGIKNYLNHLINQNFSIDDLKEKMAAKIKD